MEEADPTCGDLYHLPTELWEKILADPALDSGDLYSFSRTCSVFSEIVGLNSLWRIKFKQR